MVDKKHTYMTVLVPGTKKVSVCARRIGTRDRLSVIAVANSEEAAEKIVDALNTLQGQLEQLDAPSRRDLEIARQATINERKMREEGSALLAKARSEKRDLESKLHEVSRDLATMTARVNKLENPAVIVNPEPIVKRCM